MARSYTANGLNQYTEAGGASLAYDLNGNLSSSPDTAGGASGGTHYTYDAENRLVAASGVRNATLAYDPLGRLFQVTGGGATTQFVYDGDELVAEYDGAGTLVRRYAQTAPAPTIRCCGTKGAPASRAAAACSSTTGASVIAIAQMRAKNFSQKVSLHRTLLMALLMVPSRWRQKKPSISSI